MRKSAALLAIIIVTVLYAFYAQASSVVPRTFNYQGYLTQSDGTPVMAPVKLTFSLYSSSKGGSPLWTEEHKDVPVNNGIYSVVMGVTTPINLPFDVQYYLATQVAADREMTPRLPLSSVPFALRAGCNPGDMISCYSGDLATLNTGLCKAGVRACNAEGTGFGPCLREVVPDTPTGISVSSDSSTASIGGSPITVSAWVTRAAGGAAPNGTVVTFTASIGSLSANSAVTFNGQASVTLSSAVAGAGSVTATVGGASSTTGVSFTDPNVPSGLMVTANPPSGTVASGALPVTISANVYRAAGGAVPDGTVVNFAVTSGSGTLSAASATTVNGLATVSLSATAAGTTTVTARAGTVSNTVTVPFSNQSNLVIVTVATSGTLPAGATIGAITTSVTYPTVGLAITSAGATATGAAAGSLLVANANTPGTIKLGLINPTGIQTGEFATLRFYVAGGPPLSANSFAIAPGATIMDTNSTALPGLSVVIQSVNYQFDAAIAPSSITVTANPPAGITNAPVAISANVNSSAGGVVPDGTVVNFAVSSGPGTLSASSASTTNGSATVSLSGAAAGTITVTASAGTVSNTVTVPFASSPTLAIVKIGTTGTLPVGRKIGGVTTSVGYPSAGLTIRANTDTTTFGDISASGAGASGYLVGNTSTAGSVGLGTVSTSGFLTGEFATLTFHVAPGTTPTANQFTIVGPNNIVDTTTASLNSAITPAILNVTLQ